MQRIELDRQENAFRIIALSIMLATSSFFGPIGAFAQDESPRRTKTVEVIQRVEPGVVAVFPDVAPRTKAMTGSGSVIGDRFILTNDHVPEGRPGVALIRGVPPIRYTVIGRLPEKDLSLLRIDVAHPLVAIPLGRSHDLMTGEPAIVGGNPGGFGIVFSSGIVSSPSVIISSNALTAAISREQSQDRFIQIDAAVNPGNSGGPLVNAEGYQIGIVTRKNLLADNIAHAIPIDRVRKSFRDLAAPEDRGGFWTGLTIDPLGFDARVVQIEPKGPAERCGIRPGDRLVSLDGKPLQNGLAWLLGLIGRHQGETLTLTLNRPEGQLEVALKLMPFGPSEFIEKESKAPGLRYEVAHGELSTLDELHRLTPTRSGTTDSLDLSKLDGTDAERYAAIFRGYIEIPEDNVYHLILSSDDGSRLYIDEQLVVDNDGNHPVQAVRSVRRLSRGLHRMRLEYFQGGWGASLGFRLDRDNAGTGADAVTLKFFRD